MAKESVVQNKIRVKCKLSDLVGKSRLKEFKPVDVDIKVVG